MPTTVNLTLPSLPVKAVRSYIFQVVKEIVQTAFLAGAAAGLTLLGDKLPVIDQHYGVSPLLTAQLVALVGSARAFVSGLNSVKVGQSANASTSTASAPATAAAPVSSGTTPPAPTG